MGEIHIHIPAIPVAQPRPRATIVGGHARVYDATKHPVQAFKATARLAAKEAYDGPPLSGPIRLNIEMVFPRLKAQTWKRREMPRIEHVKKPDVDNCIKSILDALNGLMFVDDRQVCQCEVNKWIAAGDEQPHVEVRIWELGEPAKAVLGG